MLCKVLHLSIKALRTAWDLNAHLLSGFRPCLSTLPGTEGPSPNKSQDTTVYTDHPKAGPRGPR